MVLVAGEPGEEDDARLVEAGRGLEEVAGELDGRVEDLAEALGVAGVEGPDRLGRERGEGVEDAQQGVAEALFVAGDELRVVEVVARVAADALREAAAQLDLAPRVEEETLMPSTLSGWAAMTSRKVSVAVSRSAEPQ